MKNYNEIKLVDDEICSLEDELEELLDKSEKILGYKSYDINQIVNDLFHKNTDISITLATDILDVKDEMIIISEKYSDDEFEDDPFDNLKDEDED